MQRACGRRPRSGARSGRAGIGILRSRSRRRRRTRRASRTRARCARRSGRTARRARATSRLARRGAPRQQVVRREDERPARAEEPAVERRRGEPLDVQHVARLASSSRAIPNGCSTHLHRDPQPRAAEQRATTPGRRARCACTRRPAYDETPNRNGEVTSSTSAPARASATASSWSYDGVKPAGSARTTRISRLSSRATRAGGLRAVREARRRAQPSSSRPGGCR